jgi:hypothetical protein
VPLGLAVANRGDRIHRLDLTPGTAVRLGNSRGARRSDGYGQMLQPWDAGHAWESTEFSFQTL